MKTSPRVKRVHDGDWLASPIIGAAGHRSRNSQPIINTLRYRWCRLLTEIATISAAVKIPSALAAICGTYLYLTVHIAQHA